MTTDLSTLCAAALTQLPTTAELVDIGRRLFTAIAPTDDFRVSYTDENASRMGDSLADRSATLRCGRYRMHVGADWLDRRDADGRELDGPRGLVDLRVRVVDERVEAELQKNPRRTRRADTGPAEVKFVMCRADDAATALRTIIDAARAHGWKILEPRLELVALVA